MFHPVIQLPPDFMVYDMTKGPDPRRRPGEYGIGRYNEKRPQIYKTELFAGIRDNHLGIDIFCPEGTPIHAFDDGEFLMTHYNSASGDYGYTLITRHVFENRKLYCLWGHLKERSIENKSRGQAFKRGEIIAWVGGPHENGGWANPHLHFQISFEEPRVCDMPGVVSDEDLPSALQRYPDPRLVLGPLY